MCRKSLLALSLLCLLSVPCLATSYTVTEPELTRLLQITNELSNLNSQLSQDLAISQNGLMESQAKLTQYQKDLDRLTMELQGLNQYSETLKEQLTQAMDLLKNNSESLKKLKHQINSLVWQRNIAAVIAFLALAIK